MSETYAVFADASPKCDASACRSVTVFAIVVGDTVYSSCGRHLAKTIDEATARHKVQKVEVHKKL